MSKPKAPARKSRPTANPLVSIRLAQETIDEIDTLAATMSAAQEPGAPRYDRGDIVRMAVLGFLKARAVPDPTKPRSITVKTTPASDGKAKTVALKTTTTEK